MSKTITSIVAAVSLLIASCAPPEVPPSRNKPNAPYPPDAVEPYGQTTDPYAQTTDIAPPATGSTTPPAAPATPGEYPTARPTTKPGEVISPYEPYNVIDVTGFHSGQLARDPSNKKIFRVP